MKFTTLYFRSGRIARGEFEIASVSGVPMFVGDQEPPPTTGPTFDPRRPPAQRIAVPVGAVEFAVPAENAAEQSTCDPGLFHAAGCRCSVSAETLR